MEYNYDVPNCDFKLEYHEPSEPPGGVLHFLRQIDRRSRRVIQDCPYRHVERDPEILGGGSAALGEFLSGILG